MNKYEAVWFYGNDSVLLASKESGRLLDANPQAERLLGRSLSEIKTMHYTDLHPADQLPIAMSTFGHPGTTANIDLLRPDGTRIPVYISIGNFPDDHGQIIAIGSFRNDSAHQNVKNALLRSNWALAAIRRVNTATVTAHTEVEMMRLVCDAVIGDIFVLAWIGIANNDAQKTISVVAASGCTTYLDGLEVSWDDVPHGRGPTGCAVRSGKTQINNFVRTSPLFQPWAERAQKSGIESSIAIPLIRGGKAFGAITIYSNQSNAFGPDEVRLFEDMARDIVFSLNAKHAFATVIESERSYRLLFDNMRDGIAHCRMHYEGEVPVDFTYLNVNPSFYRLTGLQDVIGKKASELIPGLRESNPEILSIYGRVARTGMSERFETKIELLGAWFSVSAYSAEQDHFVAIFDNITDRKHTEERLSFLVRHDPLTSLPNRFAIRGQFEQIKSYSVTKGTQTALLLLDIDDFKFINDTLGHLAGDILLQQVAIRLHECLRTTDILSRQGGDEFLIILPTTQGIEEIVAISIKILKHLTAPFIINGRELSSSASIGIAVFPGDGDDFDTLFRKADTAMYHAKKSGRNRFRFFECKMNIDVEDHLTIRNELRMALDRTEFVLHYQPQVDLVSGLVIGAEALIRWNHPKLGQVSPGRFIPIAEEHGLIVPIGEWVLREACRQAMCWQQDGLPELNIAVNLSSVQFEQHGLEQTVLSALKETDLRPSLLELELTESILIGDTEKVLSTIQHLKAVGVQLSIDDFGTGYSSLAYLKRFAVDKLKIDQSFVRGLGSNQSDEAIVRAIIQMARSLGLRTIAEGVENECAQQILSAFACDEVQGFYIARPMCADDFMNFVRRNRKIPPNH